MTSRITRSNVSSSIRCLPSTPLRDLHPVAGLLQPSLEVVGRLGLVLHHQNSHRVTLPNVRRRPLKNVSEATQAVLQRPAGGAGDHQPLQKRNALATVLTAGTGTMHPEATSPKELPICVSPPHCHCWPWQCLPGLNANAATPTPITQQNVSLALADGLIQQTLDACHAQNRTAVVAVVDRGGNLVALRRDDNVGPHNPGRAAHPTPRCRARRRPACSPNAPPARRMPPTSTPWTNCCCSAVACR